MLFRPEKNSLETSKSGNEMEENFKLMVQKTEGVADIVKNNPGYEKQAFIGGTKVCQVYKRKVARLPL